jgi:hypothetical protein
MHHHRSGLRGNGLDRTHRLTFIRDVNLVLEG